MIISLDRMLPSGSSDLTRTPWTGRPSSRQDNLKIGLTRHVFLFGLAPGGVYHASDVAIKAVSSYLTVSNLPASTSRLSDWTLRAVCFLWHFP